MTSEEKTVLKYLAYALPLIFIAVSLPLALKLIPPNGTYGFRNSQTLGNPDVWYAVNSVGGSALTLAGLVSLAFVHWLHKHPANGSIRKLFASYSVSLILMVLAIGVSAMAT